jgi:hypothetical protein
MQPQAEADGVDSGETYLVFDVKQLKAEPLPWTRIPMLQDLKRSKFEIVSNEDEALRMPCSKRARTVAAESRRIEKGLCSGLAGLASVTSTATLQTSVFMRGFVMAQQSAKKHDPEYILDAFQERLVQRASARDATPGNCNALMFLDTLLWLDQEKLRCGRWSDEHAAAAVDLYHRAVAAAAHAQPLRRFYHAHYGMRHPIFTDVTFADSGTICGICLDDFQPSTEDLSSWTSLPCKKHLFHKRCLGYWVRSKEQSASCAAIRTCPTCRGTWNCRTLLQPHKPHQQQQQQQQPQQQPSDGVLRVTIISAEQCLKVASIAPYWFCLKFTFPAGTQRASHASCGIKYKQKEFQWLLPVAFDVLVFQLVLAFHAKDLFHFVQFTDAAAASSAHKPLPWHLLPAHSTLGAGWMRNPFFFVEQPLPQRKLDLVACLESIGYSPQ